MAAMTIQTVTKAGLSPAYAAAADGDTIANPTDQRTLLHVKNGGGGSITVTIPAVLSAISDPRVGSVDVADLSVAVPAGEERMIGPFPAAYVDSAGDVTVNYSGVASVTAAALRLPSN